MPTSIILFAVISGIPIPSDIDDSSEGRVEEEMPLSVRRQPGDCQPTLTITEDWTVSRQGIIPGLLILCLIRLRRAVDSCAFKDRVDPYLLIL